MNWAEFGLILFIAVALIVLAYLNFHNFSHFMENYFIILIIIIFVILIITVSFNNSIQITTYIKVKTPPSPIIYNIPTQDDSQISNLFTFNFSGTYDGSQVTVPAGYTGNYIFNYDTLTENTPVDVPNFAVANLPFADTIFTVTRLANNQLKLEIKDVLADKYLDGYISFALLAQGNQSINGGFERTQ
jgi:hypothetical protein